MLLRFQVLDLAIENLKSEEHWGLAPHAPFTASRQLYARSAQVAPMLTTHLAESHEESSMFQDGEGALFEFLKEIGRDMTDCGGRTPVDYFSSLAIEDTASPARTRPYLLVH